MNKVPHRVKVAADVQEMFLDSSGMFFCDECQMRLGLLHTLRYALFKKQGTPYIVPCRYCSFPNKRVKGEAKQHFDTKWEEPEE